jgi:methylthioribose-1-phosphate isomerase
MTQCNAGALATGGIGTALGVFRIAYQQGKKLHVLVPETRPYLQGARLTAWELHKGGIPLTLITDNMVGHFLKTGKVGAIVTGADRIAANGDTANKIGTYQIAVLAKENNVPFYIAAPSPPSISRSPTAITFPSRSAPPPKSRTCKAFELLPTFTPLIPPSMSPPRATSLPSSPNAASPALPTPIHSALLPRFPAPSLLRPSVNRHARRFKRSTCSLSLRAVMLRV